MEYSDTNRGMIQFGPRIRQVIRFDNLRFGSITPTDIDAMIEYHDKAFILYEYKHRGAGMSEGQRLALTRHVDALTAAGKLAALLLCEHDTEPDEDVDAGAAEVTGIYWGGSWRAGTGKTARECTEAFLDFARLFGA